MQTDGISDGKGDEVNDVCNGIWPWQGSWCNGEKSTCGQESDYDKDGGGNEEQVHKEELSF